MELFRGSVLFFAHLIIHLEYKFADIFYFHPVKVGSISMYKSTWSFKDLAYIGQIKQNSEFWHQNNGFLLFFQKQLRGCKGLGSVACLKMCNAFGKNWLLEPISVIIATNVQIHNICKYLYWIPEIM